MISKHLHASFRIHFGTLFGSVTNLTFTLFCNCSIVFLYTALEISLKKSFSQLDLAIGHFSVLNAIYVYGAKIPSG